MDLDADQRAEAFKNVRPSYPKPQDTQSIGVAFAVKIKLATPDGGKQGR
jgi:hypothetical protein